MSAYPTYLEDEGRELDITGKLAGIMGKLAGIMARLQRDPRPVAQPPRCPALRDDETECRAGSHFLKPEAEWRSGYYDKRAGEYVKSSRPAGSSGASRDCPMKRYRSERQRLKEQLALCGYPASFDEIAQPIHEELWKLLDDRRDVAGLEALIGAIAALRKDGPRASGHAAFVGTVGTAKTHVLLLLYFWALWHGVSALWLTSSEVRELAQELRAFDEERLGKAQDTLATWRKKKLLVFDDLGDALSDVRARDPGSTPVAALYQDLLNGSEARLFWSSNLGLKRADDQQTGRIAIDELRKHPDLGPRVVDRLHADHRGVPCIKVQLEGPSQRHHQARRQRGKKEAA